LPLEGEGRFSFDTEPMTARSVSLEQTFTRWGKRHARANIFGRKATAAMSERSLRQASLRRDTVLAWLDRYYQERLLGLLRQQRQEASLQVDAADASYRGGNGSQADLFASRMALEALDDRIQEAEVLLSNAEDALNRWVGEAAHRPSGQRPDIWHTRLTPAMLEANPDLYPDVTLAQSQEAVAMAEAAAARQEKRADWTVDLKYSDRNDEFGDMVSVGVAIPLQWNRANRQEREVAASLATAQQLRSEREELKRERQLQTHSWFSAWQTNRERFQRYEKNLVPLSRQRTQATLATYRGGNGSLASVLEARETEIATRMEQLALEMETANLWAQLEYLLPPASGANKASGGKP
jgi:outer membrane protein TolC